MSDTLTNLRVQNAKLRDELTQATEQLAKISKELAQCEKDKQEWKSMAHSLLIKIELEKHHA